MQEPAHHSPILVQAPVRALDPDGAGILTIGTVGFGIASIACWLNRNTLNALGQGWWLGVCLVGVAIGLVGMTIAWTKHRRRKARLAAEPADAEDSQPRQPVENGDLS